MRLLGPSTPLALTCVALALAACPSAADDEPPVATAGDEIGDTDDESSEDADTETGSSDSSSEESSEESTEETTEEESTGTGECEVDTDMDGVNDCDDACPEDPEQWTDADEDGVCDEVLDECPEDPEGWADTNDDGLCNGDDDADGDGILNGEEMIYGEDCAVSNPNKADSDNDGIPDPEDLYPLDPFPVFILFRNDLGTIDMVLSNGDGTFQDPIEIGDPFGGNADNPAYRYLGFAISDWNNDGRVDFLAIGDADPADPDNLRDLWWFDRVNNPDTVSQRLIDPELDRGIFGTTADMDNDDLVDLVALQQNKPNYISEAWLYSYTNQGNVETTNCAYSDDPANPDDCLFVRQLAVDITAWASGQWIVRHSADAVDVNGDDFRDIVLIRHSSGGNSSIPVTLLSGNGDGTLQAPGAALFTHNQSGQSPANSMVFADFDNDGIGDLQLGLDDDGDAGSMWFYPGIVNGGNYSWNVGGAFESFDLNPSNEANNGGEGTGVTASAKTFDFDFDGNMDVMVGYNTQTPWAAPSQTVYLSGNGDGTFAPAEVVRVFPDSTFGQAFQIPKRICQPFDIGN